MTKIELQKHLKILENHYSDFTKYNNQSVNASTAKERNQGADNFELTGKFFESYVSKHKELYEMIIIECESHAEEYEKWNDLISSKYFHRDLEPVLKKIKDKIN